ncbi:MAG: sigma-E processing peptidase SpoIIGA [Clostridia bacterium]|nr:sigma-E processing peptidase SpoIIGA [Clostridia bacterium]
MTTIYIDALFCVNFIIDLFLINMTSVVRGNSSSLKRMALAAVVGGFAGCVLFFLPEGGLLIAARPICCMAMSYIAYGYSGRRRFVGDCIMLFVMSFILSGCVIAISQLAPQTGGIVNNSSVYFDISFRTLIFGSAAVYFSLQCLWRPGSMGTANEKKKIRVTIGENEIGFNAFVDTGNLMRDPVSRKKVIMVSPSIMRDLLGSEGKLLDDLESANVSSVFERLAACGGPAYGIAPYTAVGGRGMMITIRPDTVEVDGRLSDGYILGISADEIETACGCRALIGC